MNINVLVKIVVDHLSPALPYLLKAGDKIAEGASKQMGVDTWELAKKIWSKLGSIVTTNPFVSRAVEKVAENPSEEDAQASLRQELKELLSNNQELASELSKIIDTKSTVSSSQIDNRSGGFYGSSITIKGDASGRDMTKEIKST